MQQCLSADHKDDDQVAGIPIQKLMEKIKIFLVMKQLKEDSAPAEIIPNLFLGCLGCALNKKKLIETNITYILSACEMPKQPFPDGFKSLTININDSVEQDIISKFDQSNEFIEEALHNQKNILVHCFAGKSRSTTFIIAYLLKNHNMTVDEALDLVKSKRPIAQPNLGFMKQLKQYYEKLHSVEDQTEKQLQE